MHASADPTHRLFFALWPGEDVRNAIAARATDFDAACAPGGRAVAPQRYHLTLQFLGSFAGLPEATVEGAIAAGQQVCAPEFTLLLDRIGSFEHNRVWWLGCDLSPALRHLHGELRSALAAVGLRADVAPFVPHVTLGRGQKQRLQPQAVDPLAWPLRDFVMVDSAAGAPAYRIVRRWPLDPVNRGS
jgi:RNA 2',3'-cyclic 3'-phosphodiesterase